MDNRTDDELRFLINGEMHTVPGFVPDLTLLGYLREHLGLTGSKEGCAEGDCGACTVAIAELDNRDRLRLRPLNACLQLLPALDGKAVITIEGLGSPGALHPAQAAMVECHGSQCGFCTPGFVMSLFALFKTSAAPDRAAISDALSGNLCRCTGYRPILAAAERMYELARERGAADWAQLPGHGADNNAATADLLNALRALRRPQGLAVSGEQCSYFAPQTLAELAGLCERYPEATLLAGGTDLGLAITRELRPLPLVISVAGVPELRDVRHEPDAIVIGAAVPVATALVALAAHYPAFAEMARRFGGPAIRAAATVGGNIANASLVGDSMPALMALGASVTLRAGDQSRDLALDALYTVRGGTQLGRGEFIESIRVPRPRRRHHFRSYKIAKRFDQDIATVGAAFHLEFAGPAIAGARVAFGGMDALPRRARACEQALLHRRWDAATLNQALAALTVDFEPISDLRGSREYRRMVAGNLLRRFFAETTTATPVRIETMAAEAP